MKVRVIIMTQKKILSLFVSLCMVGSCMAAPSIAFADDEISGADANEAIGSIVSDLQVIQDTLDAYIEEKGYDARTGIEDGTTVLVEFGKPMENEDDRAAVRQEFRDYCTEHQLDASLIDVAFHDIAIDDAANLEHACELLSQFIDEQKEIGDPIKNFSVVEIGLYETPDRVVQKKVIVYCYTADEEAALAVIKAFMQENEINEDLVQILYETPVYEGTPEDRELAENIRAFLLEQGYKVHIQYIEEELSGFEGKTIVVTFPSTPVGVYLDRKAINQMIEDYCTEQQLDFSKLLIGFNEAAPSVEPVPGEETSSSQEESAADSQEESAVDEPVSDPQEESSEKEPAADSEPAEKEPAADAQKEPAEKEPAADAQAESAEEEPAQTATAGDDSAAPSAANTDNSAAELPQTGNSDMTKAAAVGLAVLLTAAGTAIAVKSRKEND